MSLKDYKDLVKLADESNFTVTSTVTGKHNVGSKHYMGLAIDVRTRDKTAKEILDFISLMRGKGVVVRDERSRPPGQKVWGGAHLHLEISGNKPSAINRSTVLKRNSKGEAVSTLQNQLVKLGFLQPKDIDSEYGEDTENAVTAFQTFYKIHVDGEAGDETKDKLAEVLAAQSFVTAEVSPNVENYKVSEKAPQGMYIRSAPVVSEATKIAVLPMGQAVKKLTESSTPDWWQVSTDLQGSEMIGYVNSKLLVPANKFTAPKTLKQGKEVHLQRTGEVTRRNKIWAYALNENGQPMRDPKASAAAKAKALTDIIGWLDVENPAHLRYQPIAGGNTYCNIYAYDYCYLADVYLPRVWWNSKALADLIAGKSVAPVYGETVDEVSANSLFRWLKDNSADFGWTRTSSLEEMQEAANNGQVAIICAANKIPNRSGHIVAVVPETAAHRVERQDGAVTKPLMSQAGRKNHNYYTDNWWIRLSENFREFGFWINAE